MALRELAFDAKMAVAKPGTRRLYRELLHNQQLPVDQLTQLSAQRSADIACFAYDTSPFYRDLYTAAGLTRGDVQDPSAFSTLPVVDRTMIKDHSDAIRVPGLAPRDTRPALTGGSTGEPLRTWNDARVPLQPLSWRLYSWWGVSPSDDVVHLGRWAASRRARLTTTLVWWPTRVELVDASNLEPGTVAALVELIARRRPPLIEGYVGALLEIARQVERTGRQLHPPRALGGTAAPLTDEVRHYLETTLGAPMHDQYRCSEIPWMAGECARRDGLHVFADMRRIEVVDDSGTPLPPGVTGDLVVTDLANRAFPLVRYRLGDRSSLRAGTCPCGMTLPVMEPIDGRTADVIRLPDGTAVAGGLFSIFSKVPTAVRQFRLHQNVDYSIDLQVVLGDSPTAEHDARNAADALQARLRRQVPVRVAVVADLPYTGGKLKYVTSDITPRA